VSMATEAPTVTLVLGGARSGKSAFAQQLATELGESVLFVATASPLDEEMAERIAAHREARPSSWRTAEAALRVGAAVRETVLESGGAGVVVLDCLTLLVSNCLMAADRSQADGAPKRADAATLLEEELASLLEETRVCGAHLIVVSNEVGMGIVPPYPLGRRYRDLLGEANQRLAEAAAAVYLLVAGIPVELKSLAIRLRGPRLRGTESSVRSEMSTSSLDTAGG